MKNRVFLKAIVCLMCAVSSVPAMAQFNLKKAISGAVKATQAVTLTDEQMGEYVKEYITWMDANNQVCADDNEYTIRLKKLTEGLGDADGIPLNFKVYYVTDVNAFACADGSVRVFSSLMDIMSDEELLGVIGHEIGHVAHRDSKKGFRTALLTSALKDGISSQGGKAATLTDSQLGDLTEALVESLGHGAFISEIEIPAGAEWWFVFQQIEPVVLHTSGSRFKNRAYGRTCYQRGH